MRPDPHKKEQSRKYQASQATKSKAKGKPERNAAANQKQKAGEASMESEPKDMKTVPEESKEEATVSNLKEKNIQILKKPEKSANSSKKTIKDVSQPMKNPAMQGDSDVNNGQHSHQPTQIIHKENFRSKRNPGHFTLQSSRSVPAQTRSYSIPEEADESILIKEEKIEDLIQNLSNFSFKESLEELQRIKSDRQTAISAFWNPSSASMSGCIKIDTANLRSRIAPLNLWGKCAFIKKEDVDADQIVPSISRNIQGNTQKSNNSNSTLLSIDKQPLLTPKSTKIVQIAKKTSTVPAESPKKNEMSAIDSLVDDILK